MHAGFDELSEIAAGRQAAGIHVPACPDCRTRLEQVRRVRAGLLAMPELTPPPVAWSSIRVRESAGPTAPRSIMPVAAAASVLVAIAVAVLTTGRPQPGAEPARVSVRVPLDSLVAENGRLEALLSQLPESRTTRIGTAYTMAAIEDRLALVDDRITTVTLEPYAPEVAEALWRERVTLMNSLVQVHYARALASR